MYTSLGPTTSVPSDDFDANELKLLNQQFTNSIRLDKVDNLPSLFLWLEKFEMMWSKQVLLWQVAVATVEYSAEKCLKYIFSNHSDLFFRFTLKPHSGSGLLQRAVKCGATVPHLPRIIAALLHANCDVNGIFDEEGTALHIAALRDLPSVCDTLLKQGANVNAVVEAHVPRMTKTSMAGRTPLFDAVSRRNARVVDVLLRHNADVCHLTDDGMSALHLACSIHTGDDFWPEQSNTVRQLLDAKADLSLVVPKLGTPLATAITRGQFQAVKTILARHSLKLEPISPLFVAVEAKQNAVELTTLLVQQDVDLNARNAAGDTPFAFACSKANPDLMTMLMSTEVLESPNNENNSPLLAVVQQDNIFSTVWLLDHGANVHFTNSTTNKTALHMACDNLNLVLVKRLISAGIDVNCRTKTGASPLLCAIAASHGPLGEKSRECFEICQTLLENNVDCSFVLDSGEDALLLAAQRSAIGVVRMLRKRHCAIPVLTFDIFKNFGNAIKKFLVFERIIEVLLVLHSFDLPPYVLEIVLLHELPRNHAVSHKDMISHIIATRKSIQNKRE